MLAALRRSIEENAELRRQVEANFKERAQALAAQVLEKAVYAGPLRIAALHGPMVPEMVKNVAFGVRAIAENDAVAFVAATKDAAAKPLLPAKGGGGGQPGFAQAGGKDAEGLATAMDKMTELLKA